VVYSGKLGTVGTLGSSFPLHSPSFLFPPLPFSPLLLCSGVVANLKLWERSKVLFPFIPVPFPPFPFSPLFSPTLSSPLLSGGNNFNRFPENQFSIDFAFLCKPA